MNEEDEAIGPMQIKNSKIPSFLKKKWVLAIIFVLLLSPIVAVGAGYYWYNQSLQAVGSGKEVVFTIEKGESSTKIASNLHDLELISSELSFNWYLRRQGVRNSLQAGSYLLSDNMTVQDIVEKFVSGDVSRKKVRIPAGYRLDQIRDLLLEEGYTAEQVDLALQAAKSHPALRYAPQGADLEGYILPETYLSGLSAPAGDFLQLALKEMDKLFTDELIADLAKQGLSPHEAVILASIVQKEADDPEIQKQVAQVFLTRLDRGIQLGSDVTFLYAAKILGVKPSTTLDSPYNTRIYKGLPPGPISNFNASALKAVANPAEGSFLYFVAGDDGTVYFSETLAEHERKADLYCIELCKL